MESLRTGAVLMCNTWRGRAYDKVTGLSGVIALGEIWIDGGKPLAGQIRIQGSKNAALPMMAAALLHEGVTVLRGCPRIADVYAMEKILRTLGVKTCWQDHTLTLDCRKVKETEIRGKYAESMRSSVILMGSMLSRRGHVCISYPGGCTIGKRPIDLHLKVFRAMGATVEEQEGEVCAFCGGRMKGSEITFPISSVGATENGILAAVKAKGITILRNCAAEPEIFHLCHFLQAMGAEIGGIGTRTLWIRGVQALRNVEYTVPADRIVAGTYLYAAAATRGDVVLENAPVEEMAAVLQVYEKMGGQWESSSGKLKACARGVREPVSHLETACYPGFPTDMQSILMAVLLTVWGESRIQEQIFEDRFKVVPELARMGAAIAVTGREAWIRGSSLQGTVVKAQELRGGAALVVAGLAAEGTTVIHNSHFIERGYENIEQDISNLGGRIKISLEKER